MKNLKRFSSIAVTAAMLFSVCFNMPASAATGTESSTEPTLRVGETLQLVDFLDSCNSEKRQYGWYNWDGSACIWETGLASERTDVIKAAGGNVYDAKVNVEQAGTYTLTYRAVNGDAISSINVSVNGTAYSFTEADGGGFSGYSTGIYTSVGGVDLNEGINTIEFSVALAPPGNNGFVAALDYVGLEEYTAAVPEFKIGEEMKLINFVNDNKQAYGDYKWTTGWGSGVAFWHDGVSTDDNNAIQTNEVNTYTAKVNVAAAGKYTLTYGAADYNGTVTKVAVNGVSYSAVAVSESTYTGGYKMQHYKTTGGVQFNQGENIIVFTVGVNDTGDGFDTALDYMKYEEWTEPTVVIGEKIECEGYIDGNDSLWQSAWTGARIWEDITESKTYDMTVNLAEAGSYSLEVGAATYASSNYLSPVSISVNGEELGYLKSADGINDAFATESGEPYYTVPNNDAFTFKRSMSSIPIAMNAGANTITFTVYDRASVVNEGYGTYAVLDYIKFLEPTYPALVPGEKLEAEAFLKINSGFSNWKPSASGASNGNVAYIGDDNTESAEYKMYFNVAEAGTYSFVAGVAAYGVADYFSPVSVTINGVDCGYIQATDGTGAFNKLDSNAYLQADGWGFRRFALKNSLQLNEGTNEVVFKVYNRSVTGTVSSDGTPHIGCHAGFDYISIEKLKTLDNLSVSIDSTIAVGDLKAVTVKSGDTVVKISDVSSMTCSSSIENIVKITALNDQYYITGLEPGTTVIKVEIRVNSSDIETVILEADVTVTAESDVYITDAYVNDDGSFSFTVNNNQFDDLNGVAYAACYDGGLLKDVKFFEIKNLSFSEDCTGVFKDYNSAYTTKIMIFDSMGKMIPLMKAKEL